MKMTLCPYCMKEVADEMCPYCGNSTAYTGKPAHLPCGYVLQGTHPYILGAALGQGGFGITYIALDMVTNERVAVKEYYPTYCAVRTDQQIVTSYAGQEAVFDKGKDRFLDEARVLKSLSDLNSIVNVLDFFEFNNSAYLVMEFLEGDSLKLYAMKNGRFPAQAFLQQLRPLMEDIERMHQRGVVHRDIAPDNIILTPDGQMKLIDFGAARSYVGDKSMTVVVKKGFAPIEQYMRHGSTAATDVYALAATIYYCITGIVPPDSAERQYDEESLKSPISLGAELSILQEQAILKALTVQPKKRTQSVAELLKALEHAPKLEKPRPVKKDTKAEPKKKNNWLIPAVAAVLVCILGGVLFLGKESPAAPAQTEPAQIAASEATVPETTIPETEPPVILSEEAQKYNEAVDFFNNGEYGKAAIAFAKLGDYRDAKENSFKIWDAIADRKTIVVGHYGVYAIKEDGTGWYSKFKGDTIPDATAWSDMIAVDWDGWKTDSAVGLRSDGTVLVSDTRKKPRKIDKDGWTDIVSITVSGDHVFGIKSDGTVVAHEIISMGGGITDAVLEKAAKLKDVVRIKIVRHFTDRWVVSLWAWLADGTVLKDGEPYEDQTVIDVEDTLMLKKDGTVRDVSGTIIYTDVVSILGYGGRRADGTFVGGCPEDFKKLEADIVTFTDGIALKSDGTLLASQKWMTGWITKGYREKINNTKNIRLPANRDALLAAIELSYITEE